jgi:orotate phosphoribosyltransferase
VAFGEYSPGLVTSMLTVPLWRRLTSAALAEKLLTRPDVVACTLLAGIVHAAVVARQVFFVGVPGSR